MSHISGYEQLHCDTVWIGRERTIIFCNYKLVSYACTIVHYKYDIV